MYAFKFQNKKKRIICSLLFIIYMTFGIVFEMGQGEVASPNCPEINKIMKGTFSANNSIFIYLSICFLCKQTKKNNGFIIINSLYHIWGTLVSRAWLTHGPTGPRSRGLSQNFIDFGMK